MLSFTEGSAAVVDGDYDNTLLQQIVWSVDLRRTGASSEPSSVDPHHHGFLGILPCLLNKERQFIRPWKILKVNTYVDTNFYFRYT